MGEEPSMPIWSYIYNILDVTEGGLSEFSARYQELDDEGRTKLGTRYIQKYCGTMPFKESNKQITVKSSSLSVDLRKAGNKQFMKKNDEALLLYTRSISAAPYPTSDEEGSEELALGFANRSAVYFEINKYEACVRDIEHAMMFNYPDRLKYKLLQRRAVCCQIMGRKEDALASAQEARDHVKAATHLSDHKIKLTIDALNSLQLNPGDDKCKLPATTDALKTIPAKDFKQHPNIPSAADCMEVKYNEEMGRHFVATRDIGPGVFGRKWFLWKPSATDPSFKCFSGDVFLVEKPFASCLCEDSYSTHCFNCTKRSDAMVPCKMCNYAMFCSTECRAYAWHAYHNVECRLIPRLNDLDIGAMSLLPLRLFLTACSKSQGLEGLHRLVSELEAHQASGEMKEFDQDDQYKSSDYRQIHHLFRNKLVNQRQQLLHTTIAACILNALDEHADFFSGTTQSKEAKLKFASGLILKLVDILNINTVGVGEFVIGERFNDKYPGRGVYSAFSLFAHSCDPNVATCFYNGSTQVLLAGRTIASGEIMSVCYGSHFSNCTITTRHFRLREKYCFDCKCHACIHNWPVIEELPDVHNCTFVCHECRSPLLRGRTSIAACRTCNKKYNVASLRATVLSIHCKLLLIIVEILKGTTMDFTPELAGYVKIVRRYLEIPNQLSCEVEEVLRTTIKARGNVHRC